MQIDELKEKTADLADHVEDLANTFYRLTVINFAQKTSNIVSGIVVGVVIGIFAFFVLLFLGIAFAWWMGDVLNSRTGGFLAGAGLFILLAGIVALLRKKIISPIRDLIVKKIFD
jgi:preprotein translocase subunit SecY